MDHLVLFCAANVEGEGRTGTEAVELVVAELDVLDFEEEFAREDVDLCDSVVDLDEAVVLTALEDFELVTGVELIDRGVK